MVESVEKELQSITSQQFPKKVNEPKDVVAVLDRVTAVLNEALADVEDARRRLEVAFPRKK